MTPSFRGVSPRVFAEKKKMVCTNLREISRSFLRESSRLRIFVRGVNAKKELFAWADLYQYPTCDIQFVHDKRWADF